MAGYTKTDNSILRDDGACIPIDPTNVDYQAFLNWVSAGNVPILFDTFSITKAADIAAFLIFRESKISRLTGIAVAAQQQAAPAIVTAAVNARQSLVGLLTLPSVTGATNLVDFRAAVRQEYLNIVAAMPPALKNAFNQLDS